MSFFYWNPTYWLFVAPAIVLMMIAQWRVKRAYAKWSKVRSAAGVSGMKAAEQLMAQDGLHGVGIRGIEGTLSDNYDPRNKTLNLSRANAMGDSVASLAVVAHEIGHAMQDSKGYLPLRLRSGLVPVVNFGSQLGPILFLVGILLQFGPLMWLGIIFFASAFVFALVTLPVELDASRRAIRMLDSSNLLIDRQDRQGARAVLNAAALTYVAGMLTALMQLLYYISLARGRRR